MIPSLRAAGAFALISTIGLCLGQLGAPGTMTVAHAQANAQEQARAAQQRAAQQAAAARAAQQRAAQQQAAAARAAQQRAAQQQAAAARAAQQRAAQQQAAAARAAQQRAAQEQARAAQQRAAQEQARAAQQRAAQEQARAAQQRAAEERSRAVQQRAGEEQTRAAQQRAAQERTRAAQQRAAEEQARAAQLRAEQRRGDVVRPGPAGRSGPDQDRPVAGQDRQRAYDARGRHAEAPSPRMRQVQRQREQRRQNDHVVIREPDRRAIVKDNDHAFIRHDDNQRLSRVARAARSARQGNTVALSFGSRNGARVYSEVNADGRALRRYRRTRDGREIVLFDDRPFYGAGLLGLSAAFVDLSPPVVELPQDQYIVDYDAASEDDVYQALAAPPIEPLARNYALEEIRQGFQLRERMRSVELLDINFETGSWEIAPEQYPKLERLARAMNRILQDRPDEVFFIEGHTDVLDSDVDNLTLSDRRAEAVAFILSQMFGVPAENLVTQGYGDQYLKADAGKINRRVSVRRITPLLRHDDAPVAMRSDQGTPSAPLLNLSEDDRTFILENLDHAGDPGLGIGGISEGMRVPGGARLRSFPSVIRERLPALDGFRYFVAENQIAVVDPASAQVIAVMEGNR
jgi:outer membrane protein OmpA-like peptidoglycan-associated protein